MNLCINPNCSHPQNPKSLRFCQTCGSDLLLEERYRIVRPLGSGGFGKTYEVDDSGTPKVLKVLINTHPKAVELFQKEVEVLYNLRHFGIPKVEANGYFTFIPRNSSIPLHCLVMEKIAGINLEQYLIQRHHEPITEDIAISWLQQLTEILQQVHQQQYFHRDIKPQNIMLKPDGHLVLIDFGTAREVTQTYMQNLAGQQVTGIISLGYTPQEQINGKAVPQSDFFALGRTFVSLLTGKQPQFFSENPHTGELIWQEYAPSISLPLANLINNLMAPFPGNRPQNTQEIMQYLTNFQLTTHNPQPPANTLKKTVKETVFTQIQKPNSLQLQKAWLSVSSILLLGGLAAGINYSYLQSNFKLFSSPNLVDSSFENCKILVADPDDPTLNVRSSPEVKPNNIVGQLKNETQISVQGEQKGWLQVKAPIQGWVAKNRTTITCN